MEKETIETKAYTVRLVPTNRNKGNKKAKNNGKTFSAYVNELIERDTKENE